MIFTQEAKSLRVLSVAVAAAVAGMAAPLAAEAGLTGNIGVFSKYVLRGNTGTCDAVKAGVPGAVCSKPENDSTAVQGGFDWTHDSGVFVGYWGSNLGYSYSTDAAVGTSAANGFENDFYAGYSGKVGPLTYSAGITQYYYINVDDSNLIEPFATLGIGPVTLGVKYLAKDGFWGNSGDMYWTLAYATDLPKAFKFSATAGYYLYEDGDSAEICAGAGLGTVANCGLTQTDSAFRHVDLTLAHPIGKSGAEMAVTYIYGGKDRTDQDLGSTVVLSVKYPFDI
jgi:uncharacterized protein (TIGR02001 family)